MSAETFAGILAAGHGTRFLAAGEKTPKALVAVGGRSLIVRSLQAFGEAGHGCVAVVVNDAVAPAVREHLASHPPGVEVDLTVRTTGSTLETFELLIEAALEARAARFLFTTVDAVTAPGELLAFGTAAANDGSVMSLGIAPVEAGDEGPLRVELDVSGRARLGRGHYATAGFYAGRVAEVHSAVREARLRGLPSLRVFLTDASSRTVVRGIVLARALDVDTPGDVEAAERALARWQNPGADTPRT